MKTTFRAGWLAGVLLLLAPSVVRAAAAGGGDPVIVEDITVDNRGFWTGDLARDFSAVKASSGEAAALEKAYPGRWDWIQAGDLLGDGVQTSLLVSGERSRKTEDGFVVFDMRVVRRDGKSWRELARLSKGKGLTAAGTKRPGKPAEGRRGYELTLRVLRQGDGPIRMGLMAAAIGADGLPREDAVELDWSPGAKKYVYFADQ